MRKSVILPVLIFAVSFIETVAYSQPSLGLGAKAESYYQIEIVPLLRIASIILMAVGMLGLVGALIFMKEGNEQVKKKLVGIFGAIFALSVLGAILGWVRALQF